MYFDQVRNVIAETLGCDVEEVVMEANLQEDLGADSLDAVEINMAIEEAFGVTIPEEALGEMKSVGDIVRFVDANKK